MKRNKMETKEKSYVERIRDEYRSELECIEKVRELDEPEKSEDYREPLEVDTILEKRIVLSTGGPEDGFILRFRNKELIVGYYYRKDWGEGDKVALADDEAEMVYDFYLAGYIGD